MDQTIMPDDVIFHHVKEIVYDKRLHVPEGLNFPSINIRRPGEGEVNDQLNCKPKKNYRIIVLEVL